MRSAQARFGAQRLGAALVGLIVCVQPLQAGATGCADCDGDGTVTIDELITGLNIALDGTDPGACPAIDRNGDGAVTIDELVVAITHALYGCPATPSPVPTATRSAPTPPAPSQTPTPTATDAGNQLPPTEETALIAWLQAGHYAEWRAESGPHPSAGPHFGTIRTFLNDALFDSLSAAAPTHPAGAAAVKELFGRSGTTVRGWAVMVKLQDASDGGRGWYWYEAFNGSGGGGVGDPVCTGCHALGRDFIRIPFPLQ